MRRSAPGLLARPWVGALLALLTAGAVWPQEARAGCSAHYIRHGGQPGGAAAVLGEVSLAAAGLAQPVEGPRERPLPCSGALCSGNPATPLAAPTVAPPPWSSHWAFPAFLAAVTGPGSFAYATQPEEPTPVDQARTIFRPPRLPLSA